MLLKKRTYVPHVVFILIMTYAMSSFTILGLAVGILPYLPRAYLKSSVCIVYAAIAFVLTGGLSVYHLSTMIRMNKRRDDEPGRAR